MAFFYATARIRASSPTWARTTGSVRPAGALAAGPIRAVRAAVACVAASWLARILAARSRGAPAAPRADGEGMVHFLRLRGASDGGAEYGCACVLLACLLLQPEAAA